jgi:leucyl aminopeptidase
MQIKISKIAELKEKCTTAIIIDKSKALPVVLFGEAEITYMQEKLESKTEYALAKHPIIFFIHKSKEGADIFVNKENARRAGSKFYDILKDERTTSFQIIDITGNSFALPFLEGFLLSSYSFSKYKKEKEDYLPEEVFIAGEEIPEDEISEMVILTEAVFRARNLVNEPLSYLSANIFSEELEKMGKLAGFSVEVLSKKKIEALRMGGLLAVNKGSIDPPTFNILEWKPENAVNSQPVVLVGKGVMFDTGGLSLKPTAKSMDYMKCDMAGGAVVASTIFAAAKNKLPVQLIGLIPATDNRPDGNAFVPGDIITMFDGTTVEIKNTDAEGRLLLADALSYAKKYNPSLVIDVATLTGATEIICGHYALIAMGNNVENMDKLKHVGDMVYERLVELPLWDEFANALKSPVADLNNLGTREAQTSVAGKFLEHFTGYPWIHLDIAGVAFYHEKDFYNLAGGTGFGIRLLYNFLKKFN